MYIKSLLCTPFKNGIVQHRIYIILICPSYLIIAGWGGGGQNYCPGAGCHSETMPSRILMSTLTAMFWQNTVIIIPGLENWWSVRNFRVCRTLSVFSVILGDHEGTELSSNFLNTIIPFPIVTAVLAEITCSLKYRVSHAFLDQNKDKNKETKIKPYKACFKKAKISSLDLKHLQLPWNLKSLNNKNHECGFLILNIY